MSLVDTIYGLTYIVVAASIISYSVLGVNWAFRIAEASSVGFTVGLSVVTSLQLIYNTGYLKVVGGKYVAILWILVGILGALRIFPKYLMFARPATALTWGVTAAVLLTGESYNNLIIFGQWSMMSLVAPETWVLYIGLITMFAYYMWTKRFSIHEKATIGAVPKIGRWFVLFMLGEQMTSLAFKRITFVVSMVGEIRAFLLAWGIPV